MRPCDRRTDISPVLAIACERRVICRMIIERMGGQFLVAPELLDAELQRRRDIDAVELLALNHPRRQARYEYEAEYSAHPREAG